MGSAVSVGSKPLPIYPHWADSPRFSKNDKLRFLLAMEEGRILFFCFEFPWATIGLRPRPFYIDSGPV